MSPHSQEHLHVNGFSVAHVWFAIQTYAFKFLLCLLHIIYLAVVTELGWTQSMVKGNATGAEVPGGS